MRLCYCVLRVSLIVLARMSGAYIGAIDQGTSSSRFLLFDENCCLKEKHQKDINHIKPNEDWLEQDPYELVESVRECITVVMDKVKGRGITSSLIQGIGITNQRETTILWDKTTGKCFYNAIVWCDNRTQSLADMLVLQTPTEKKDYFRPKCGLPIHPYFSALKIRWIMDNVPEVQIAMAEGRCLFGTVDTWIIWNLTGGTKGGIHVTDITNACRTMLMDLQSHQWDPELCSFFGIPMSILPQIRSCSEVYGTVADGSLKGVRISGCLGDQQAALVGQRCFQKGDAKNTYGTGCFLVYNTGTQPVRSNHGLLTTVAYKLGPNEPVYYALEGSVAIAGLSVKWLRDNLLFFSEASEIENLARQVENTADVYFVPAFSGLFAPYWEHDARGIIIGLSNFTNKSHICRATLEAVCFQSREILEAMNQDSELPLASLKVDGGMTVNTLLLQLQADILGIPVEHPKMAETTVLGATLAAGKGVGLWRDLNLVVNPSSNKFYYPRNSHDDRDGRYSRWKEAVKRCKHWHKTNVIERVQAVKYKGKLIFGVSLVGVVLAVGLIFALRSRR